MGQAVLGFVPVAPLAQLAEQLTLNQRVPGSSPGGRTFHLGARIFMWLPVYRLVTLGWLVIEHKNCTRAQAV